MHDHRLTSSVKLTEMTRDLHGVAEANALMMAWARMVTSEHVVISGAGVWRMLVLLAAGADGVGREDLKKRPVDWPVTRAKRPPTVFSKHLILALPRDLQLRLGRGRTSRSATGGLLQWAQTCDCPGIRPWTKRTLMRGPTSTQTA